MGCCCRNNSTTVNPIQEHAVEQTVVDGPLKNRQCRDIFFLVLLLAYMGGMGYVSYLGLMEGNPYRLIYGVDSWGNACNQKNPNIENVSLSGKDTTGLQKSFYFNKLYFATQLPGFPSTSLSKPTSIIVCVKECPDSVLLLPSDVDSFHANNDSNLCRYDTPNYVLDSDRCPSLPVDAHVDFLNRCFPASMLQVVQSAVSGFASALSSLQITSDIPQKMVSDVETCWREILYLMAIAFGTALVLVVLLRFMAALIIWTLVLSIGTTAIAVTAYSWYSWYLLQSEYTGLSDVQQTDEAAQTVQTWLIYSSIATGVTVILLLILLILRKRIALVVVLFKEAGKALAKIPMLLFQPVWTLMFLAGSIGGLLFIALYIETSGIPNVDQSGFVTYKMSQIWTYLRWYHYFGLLWITAFICACQDLVIAGAVATWYFRIDKSKLGCPIFKSTWRLLRYHLGSVAFGSLIIAIVRFIRLILTFVEKKLKGRTNKIAEYILKALHCCLWCFEKFLRFLNRNAYIEIAIYGFGFCRAAKKGFMMIVANALRMTAINSIGDFVLFLGKLCTVAVVVIVGNEFIKVRNDVYYAWVPITLAAAFGYAIAHCFFLVYETTIDTIFLCFCEDCEQNDGIDKPYYMSKDLMTCLEDNQNATNMEESISAAKAAKAVKEDITKV